MRLLLSLAVALALAAPVAAAPKNVLLLVADDLGLQVGCYGDAVAKTAADLNGFRFENITDAADLERRPRKGEFVVLVAPATDSEEVREPDSEELQAPADS